MEIILPHEDRSLFTNSLEHLADDNPAELRSVEDEALARWPERRDGARWRWAEPFGRGGDPRQRVVVVGAHFPTTHQRLFDKRAIGALEIEVRVDGAGDTVE